MYHFIALFRGIQIDGKNRVPMNRLEYAFHTFSLENECAYAPSGDVTFASISPDVASLEGGVERMVNAVLEIDVEAVVMRVEQLRELLDTTTDDEIVVGKGMIRSRSTLEALYIQANTKHEHEH